MSKAIPELKDIPALVKTALKNHSYFTSKNVEVENGNTFDTLEKHLRNPGFYASVAPVIGADIADQSGHRWSAQVKIMVKIRLNPEMETTGINIYEAVTAAMDAICGDPRHPGGQFFRPEKEAVELSQFEKGVWGYNLYFTKDLVSLSTTKGATT